MGWTLKRDTVRAPGSSSSITSTLSASKSSKSAILPSSFATKPNEEQVIEATRAWTRDILPNWSGRTVKCTKNVQEIWWKGIPPSLREKVWQLAIGNDLNVTVELYEICLLRSKERVWIQILKPESKSKSKESLVTTCSVTSSSGVSSATSDTKSDNLSTSSDSNGLKLDEANEDKCQDEETVADQIKIDVSRTFSQLGLFQEDGPYHEPLIQVLGAYVTYRPDINYVQGMAYLAAMLLLNMSTEDAFVSFANLLNNHALLAFYRLDQRKMRAYYDTYQLLLRENLPKVHAHFELQNMTPDLYLVDWIYTLFSRSLPLDVASRVWDLFLRDGQEFIFRGSLGILAMYQDIVTKLDFIQLALFLTKLPDSIECDRLFAAINSIRMTSDKKSFQDILTTFLATNSLQVISMHPGHSRSSSNGTNPSIGSNVSIASIINGR